MSGSSSQTSLPSPNKKHCTAQVFAATDQDVNENGNAPQTSSNLNKASTSQSAMAAAGNTNSTAMNLEVPTKLHKSDEVAKIRQGKLIFGTLEYPQKEKDEWKVKWNTSDFNGVVYHSQLSTTEQEADLAFTDRSLYKGCKVRSESKNGLVGICRDVMVSVDLRVLGTSTVVTGVNIELFKHLKEFKQKSVVYKSGWLGVIMDVKRMARVRLMELDVSCEIGLNLIMPTGALDVEAPWINEEIPGVHFQPTLARFDDEQSAAKLTKRSIKSLYIQDLKVESVTVLWRYQVDAMRPDKPPQTISGARLKDLQIVMEELSSDAGFQVGNLGRYKFTSQTEFVSLDAYITNFVRCNMGETAASMLDNPFQKPKFAYDPDPEKCLASDTTALVEIVHAFTMGDIIWQDGSMDWTPGKDLIVQDGSLLDNILTPGDFLYSNELKPYGSKDDVYAVVTRYDLKDKKVTLKVLTCTSPPKMIATLCLPEASVFPHWKYKNFNKTNTVVVLHRDERICVGHVRRTNLDGKVQVLLLHNHKEEWVWPADCSVYSVKGHDLECIVSLINDDDETMEVDLHTKLLRLIQRIRRIHEIWNEATDDAMQDDSLIQLRLASVTKLRTILQELRQVEEESTITGPSRFSDESVCVFSTRIGQMIEKNDNAGDNTSPEETSACVNPDLVDTITTLCQELCKRGDELGLHLGKQNDTLRTLSSSEPMDMRPLICSSALESGSAYENITEIENPVPGSSTSLQTEPVEDFTLESNVVIEDYHPTGHVFASRTEFQPTQIQCFIKTVRNELNNLRDQCPPGIKVKAYGDRYDLFSILIQGPVNTPYANSLYLFDAVLPPTYPAVPPQFHFHSYRAGRLNPNLYVDGKVCVSLLGTWTSQNDHEKWTKESNIVQVLLSIQALILVPEPYHNEPGLEADKYKPDEAKKHCHTYNSDLIPKVMKMIIHQIELPIDPWKEEIQTYYKANLPKFINRWTNWIDVASKCTTPDDFFQKIGSDKPEYAIFPFDAKLKTVIENYLSKMRQLLVGLEGESSTGPAVIQSEELGEVRRGEEPDMVVAADEEPEESAAAAMEVDG